MTSGFCTGLMNVVTFGYHNREQKRRLKENFDGAELMIAEKEKAEVQLAKQISTLQNALGSHMTARRAAVVAHNKKDEEYWKNKCLVVHRETGALQAALQGLQQQRSNMVAQLQGLRKAHEKIESASKDDAFQQLHQLLPGQKSITKYNDKQIRQHEKLNDINDVIDDYNANTTSLAQEGTNDVFDAETESEDGFADFMRTHELEEALELDAKMDTARLHANTGSPSSHSHGRNRSIGLASPGASTGIGAASPRAANAASLDTT
jgi:hypothetical protein